MSLEYLLLMARLERIEEGLNKLYEQYKPKPLERHSEDWYSHHHYSNNLTDTQFLIMLGRACDQKLREKGNVFPFNRCLFDPEIKAKKRKFSKLRKIAKLEAEFCGEEEW
jgi:hypothetical protein